MTDGHNALAELAKLIEVDIRTMEFGNIAQLKRMQKAKRIVAELAKVGHLYNNEGWPPEVNPRMMILKCRAIAEEGVKK